MSERKELGKIQSAYFGIGGYQDAMIGFHVALSMSGSGVHDSRSAWDSNMIKCDDHCKWTEEDRSKQYADIVRYISDLLAAAKVTNIEQLVGIPVEVTLEGFVLKSWRILTEVL